MQIHAVLIACPDRPGLVHQITGILFRHKLNLTETQEYVDHQAGRFFMRTQFEGAVNTPALKAELKALFPEGAFCEVREQKKRSLVILASRELHCLGDLLLRHCTGELDAEISAVISQYEDCSDLVHRFSLPFKHIPVGKERKEHEARILNAILPLQPDYIVLARYMRIFSADFVSHFPGQILNIHHSFLPAFIGKDPYQQAYERGVKIIGATAHFVIQALDEGPIITQDVLAVDHSYSSDQMASRGRDVEKIVLARALKLVLQDRILIEGNRTVIFA